MRLPGIPSIDLDVGVLGTRGGRERALRVERKGDLRLRGKEGDEQEKDYGVPISLTEAYA